MSKPRLLLSWSSGKDSAWTLHRLQREDRYEIAGLVTTVNDVFRRVAMHAVRMELLEAQARAAGLPLWGEFHTFCHAGPMYRSPIAIRMGEILERDGFMYADVLAEISAAAVATWRRRLIAALRPVRC